MKTTENLSPEALMQSLTKRLREKKPSASFMGTCRKTLSEFAITQAADPAHINALRDAFETRLRELRDTSDAMRDVWRAYAKEPAAGGTLATPWTPESSLAHVQRCLDARRAADPSFQLPFFPGDGPFADPLPLPEVKPAKARAGRARR